VISLRRSRGQALKAPGNQVIHKVLAVGVRVMQLRVNSRTTGVMGLGWNVGFSLCTAPLLSFLFHILERSEEDQEKDKRGDEELLKSMFKLMYSGVSKSIYTEVKAD